MKGNDCGKGSIEVDRKKLVLYIFRCRCPNGDGMELVEYVSGEFRGELSVGCRKSIHHT